MSEPLCTEQGRPYDAMGGCSDPQCPAHGGRRPACGMCGNAPCTCGSGPVYHVLVPRWRLEKLEREIARLTRVAEAAREWLAGGSQGSYNLRKAIEALNAPEGSAP